MKFYLLTHEREFKRATNTGNIVISTILEKSRQILWQRKNPDKALLKIMNRNDTVLLFNKGEGESIDDISMIENFIILDGTWQEAGKIYNKSPYLKEMKTFTLKSKKKSVYNLRRNQKDWGFCTAECVIELLKIKGDIENSEKLDRALLEFINDYKLGLQHHPDPR